MRILHLTWTLGLGGAEEMLVDIANEQSLTEEVCIVVINDQVQESLRRRLLPWIKLILLNRRPGSHNPCSLIRLNWFAHRFRPDIVHAHSWIIGKLLPHHPSKMVLTVHATRDAEVFDNSITRYERVFAISQAVADDVRKRTGRIPTSVVLNGVHCSEIRSEHHPPDSVFRIVHLARLEHEVKGQDVLLRAFARLQKEIPGEHFQLDFIGEGESRPYLEELVRELGLASVVRFCGVVPRSTIYRELCSYDLLIQASRFEGFGLAVVEAMAAGVPVLVSDLEGPREIVDGGRFGFLFRSEDDANCATQILRIQKLQGSTTLEIMLSAARDYALQRFDVRRTAREYLTQYRAVLTTGDSAMEFGQTTLNEVDEGLTYRK